MTKTKLRLEEICTPYATDAYTTLKLNDLAAYSINHLQRNGIVVTFENVVVALFLMFPKKFCLSGFEEYPDAARVNRTLLQLRPKYRNYAVGNATRGFVLTERGKRAAISTEELLHEVSHQGAVKTKSELGRRIAPRTRYDREVLAITGSSAYSKYTAGRVDEIQRSEIFDLLSAAPYTPSRMLKKRMDDLRQIARDHNDVDVTNFLDMVVEKFSEIFGGSPTR